jgi:hypothetical protein
MMARRQARKTVRPGRVVVAIPQVWKPETYQEGFEFLDDLDNDDKILEETRLCIDLTLIHITDDRTRAGLHREIFDLAPEDLSKALAEKGLELMKPYQKGHPITYNHYFTETAQKAREEHERISQGVRDEEMIGSMEGMFKCSMDHQILA